MNSTDTRVKEFLMLSKAAKKKINLPFSAELFVLLELKHNKQSTASTIADKYGITIPAVMHKLDSLVNNGYLERRVNDSDKRKKHYNLTDKAEIYLEENRKVIDKKISNLFDYLGEKDTEEIFRLMNKIIEMEEEKC